MRGISLDLEINPMQVDVTMSPAPSVTVGMAAPVIDLTLETSPMQLEVNAPPKPIINMGVPVPIKGPIGPIGPIGPRGEPSKDTMMLKGTVGNDGIIYTVLPATYETGWSYQVITAGTYAGHDAQVDDMLVAVNDCESGGPIDTDWIVLLNEEADINGGMF